MKLTLKRKHIDYVIVKRDLDLNSSSFPEVMELINEPFITYIKRKDLIEIDGVIDLKVEEEQVILEFTTDGNYKFRLKVTNASKAIHSLK